MSNSKGYYDRLADEAKEREPLSQIEYGKTMLHQPGLFVAKVDEEITTDRDTFGMLAKVWLLGKGKGRTYGSSTPYSMPWRRWSAQTKKTQRGKAFTSMGDDENTWLGRRVRWTETVYNPSALDDDMRTLEGEVWSLADHKNDVWIPVRVGAEVDWYRVHTGSLTII